MLDRRLSCRPGRRSDCAEGVSTVPTLMGGPGLAGRISALCIGHQRDEGLIGRYKARGVAGPRQGIREGVLPADAADDLRKRGSHTDQIPGG